MSYEKTINKKLLISIFIFSIICSLAILFTPFKIYRGGTTIYWFLSGIDFDKGYVIATILPLFIICMLLIIIPLYVLSFREHFSSVAIRNMRRMLLSGSVMGIISSIVVMYFTTRMLPGTASYTVTVGFPYVYFILIIILSAVALSEKNRAKLFSEITTE